MNEKDKIKVVTHSGKFHADDVFAVAALALVLGMEDIDVVRTREESIIQDGDYVVDVGRKYDPAGNRFDHHQEDGAGERDNGIPYASFGLVWKHFGEKLAGSSEVARAIDERVVQTIDALDNGVDIFRIPFKQNMNRYLIDDLVTAFTPTWKEKDFSYDDGFREVLPIAVCILGREIKRIGDNIEGEREVEKIYQNTENKEIIILPRYYPWKHVLSGYPEPKFVIFPKEEEDTWYAHAVADDPTTFINRKNFPETWAGKDGKELQESTGAGDAVFAHRARFLVVTKTKESAIELAKKALEA